MHRRKRGEEKQRDKKRKYYGTHSKTQTQREEHRKSFEIRTAKKIGLIARLERADCELETCMLNRRTTVQKLLIFGTDFCVLIRTTMPVTFINITVVKIAIWPGPPRHEPRMAEAAPARVGRASKVRHEPVH